jgi:hypothetical protein
VPPLRRNRDFLLLQAGQFFSAAGSESTAIAYPLLVLALTHSPAKAGLVGFARLVPHAFFGLLAGAAADRWNRKLLMIGADAVRAAALATLAAAVLLEHAPFWLILLVAFVEGAGSAVFATAQPGALRGIVPARQLPAAAGAQEARRAVVRLGGPPFGGVLFGLGRALPFLADAVSYGCSIVSLLAMRAPFQETRDASVVAVHRRIAEGFRYLWGRPFLRTTAFLYGLGNFLMPGVLLIVVVVGREQGLSGGEVGVLLAMLGAATLVGSLASPLFRRSLSIRAILLLELWTWLGCWLFVAWPNVYALLAILIPFGIAAPVTDSVVIGYTVAMTPDRLLGRVESVRRTIALLIAPLGPLVAGVLIAGVSARAAVAAFAVIGLGLALWGTLSRAICDAPSLAELDEAATLSA